VARFGKKLKVEWSNSQLIPTLLLSIYSGRWAAWRGRKKKAPIEYAPATYGGIKSGRASETLPRGTKITIPQAE